APKLALYSGEKAADAMSLDERQARWCSIARSKNWTPKERRSNLINSLTGKAYRLLSKQSFDPSLDDEAVEREIWLRLHRSFGQGEKQSFKKLIAMQFCIGKDTVDCYGADIRHNAVLAFKDLDSDSHGKIAATFYWNSLPQTQAVKQSYGMWSALVPKERTLTKAIDLTRPLFEVEDAGISTQAQSQEELGAVASVPAKGQYSYGGRKGKCSKGWSSSWSSGKGANYGKGKGKAKGKGRAVRSNPYSWYGGWPNQQLCYTCGGVGHWASVCPSRKQADDRQEHKQ
ncbi:hypothetical protein FOZ63_014605, partial [Perkinsus olseni]